MPKYAYQVTVVTAETVKHEYEGAVEAATYTEAILRGYSRTINDIAKYRRDNGLDKMVIEDLGNRVSLTIRKISNEE